MGVRSGKTFKKVCHCGSRASTSSAQKQAKKKYSLTLFQTCFFSGVAALESRNVDLHGHGDVGP
jgi:hypothetical protein